MFMSFPGDSVVKNLPASAGDARDTGLVPGPERSPWGVSGNPLLYSCLGNPHEKRSLEACSPWGHQRVIHNLAAKTTTKMFLY